MKGRKIISVEPYLEEREYQRILRMKDPLESFDRLEESMTLYRSDGSFVKLTSDFGLVKVEDSYHKGMIRIIEADTFIQNLLR